MVDFYYKTVDGDKSPLPILHASLMQLPAIPDAEDWAPTELMDSDSGESLSIVEIWICLTSQLS
jgi:hypothetical protein